ncbi:N-acetylmuramoyl-L-alanine amidase [Streptomyces stelliscabiei]|uniref:N-acetylmuramoyl-L-alanine amidase n=2 Tax=Streptomyces stelliscabiei TaxID=146820 RepID=A0A8I0TQS3_9ACTN|nr:N-acetylmuramoyl-L-alanine amidase [Streptomyces stelliscabiei]KND43878.1 N-acetylmuramoyl-L-alanine amidase [Streptomyces stelliscabiei]MBE1596767.1 N-acetylmuramoyl-L-alanine amidase [Streptomyces stelliscabiei]MDX2514698.1 N-acetylmuramoyl-L-alanine amidase [Streptomyces stelliscabiei]MDX2551271.1 N-acetylmuramoyl-L-alanine amidase [Streptomyces stelliscabiei]MDX2615263.1 N-acetylmuramoyl-L-alanine amidase [Streptomyces stelliscabiei]
MSYVGPDFDPPQPRRSALRRPLTVAVAAVVVGAVAGWGVWQAVGDSGGGDGGSGSVAGPQTRSAKTPASSSGPSGAPTASDDGKDGKDGTGGGDGDKASPSGSASAPAATGPLKGKVVVIDPGHNPGNFQHTTEINRKVNIGTHAKECDTTGTTTNDGYLEARFTLDVSRRLRTLLEQEGATVKFTQDGDRAWGPCIDERARIGNEAKADAVVSIHADGSGAGNRGFHVILPGSVNEGAADTRPIVAPSRDLGERIAGFFVRATGSAPSNYVGDGTGMVTRTDLGGLNLSTVPKVFIECGNMRDSKDAALLTSGAWRQKAARGISDGITSFLEN